MIITVEVTEEDISLGKRNSCYRCPIALALLRTPLAKVGFSVNETYITIEEGDFPDYELPIEAINFIDCFDYEISVEPFTFELDIDEDDLVSDDAN